MSYRLFGYMEGLVMGKIVMFVTTLLSTALFIVLMAASYFLLSA